MRLHVTLTEEEVSFVDKMKILLLRLILPKQIVIDYEDRYRRRIVAISKRHKDKNEQ